MALKHPAIVRVLSVDTYASIPTIAMTRCKRYSTTSLQFRVTPWMALVKYRSPYCGTTPICTSLTTPRRAVSRKISSDIVVQARPQRPCLRWKPDQRMCPKEHNRSPHKNARVPDYQEGEPFCPISTSSGIGKTEQLPPRHCAIAFRNLQNAGYAASCSSAKSITPKVGTQTA